MRNWLNRVMAKWRFFIDRYAPEINWPTRSLRPLAHCHLLDSGKIVGLDRSINPPPRVCLHVSSGHCLFRKSAVSGLNEEEIESALSLWAEESLPEPATNFATDNWAIDPDSRGFVAILRAPIDDARQKIMSSGASLEMLRVPELMPPADPRSAVVFWNGHENLLACFWDQQILYDWQSFPPGAPTQSMIEQANAICRSSPINIYCYDATEGNGKPWPAVRAVWPRANLFMHKEDDPALQDQLRDSGPEFYGYVHESENLPATTPDKIRLGFAAAAALASSLFLFHADISYRERQVEDLRHRVSLLKIKANRSEKLASRSGKTLRQVREVRAMTIERDGVLKILQVLSESLPPRVKIETISVERSGATAFDGIAESEVDISSFLERLRRSSMLRDPNLSFSQKDTKDHSDSAQVRFRLEARWTEPLLILPEAEGLKPNKRGPARANVEA